MAARDKILAAFEPEGASEIGAVSCYDSLFIRDHWFALTDVPWWYAFSGHTDREAAWAQDYVRRSGLEWLQVRPCPSRAERARQRYEQRVDGVWRIDAASGEAVRLVEPRPSGTNTSSAISRHSNLDALPRTEAQVDALISRAAAFDRQTFLAEGRHDAAAAIGAATDLFLYGSIAAPLWAFYDLLGYEGMMFFLATDSDLAAYAAECILWNQVQRIAMIAALGADAVWIEECLTDQISPDLFWALNVPVMQRLVQAIRAAGLKSIYYYCGNPHDRLDAILAIGADAFHFEEGKKGFDVDLEAIAQRIAGSWTLFGNLDAIAVLPHVSEGALRREVARQLAIRRANGGRFVMSTGSPITPGTSVERMRRYTDLVRELS
ncbi:MAG: hypothetical protein JXA74_08250 [Anaerolineae bacterium]|nr:hypothetical protein [Anaerolineae bacterium]